MFVPSPRYLAAKTCSRACGYGLIVLNAEKRRRAAWEQDEQPCRKCRKSLPLYEFDSGPSGGPRLTCKDCRSRSYARTRAGQVSAETDEQKRGKADYRLQKVYGIDLAFYECLLEEQGGGCALCGKTPAQEGQRLCVDHNHRTRRIRGLLCSACNALVVGPWLDNPEIAENLIWYLQGLIINELLPEDHLVPIRPRRRPRGEPQ